LKIAVFGAIAIVFAVIGVNQGIFMERPALEAMSAGWLILAVVDVSLFTAVIEKASF
jgi:SHO1 osmosensor